MQPASPARPGAAAALALVAGAALLLVLLALAPPAQAQGQQPPVELRIVNMPDEVSPLQPAENFTLSVEYDCSRVKTDGSTLTLEVTGSPEWALLSGPEEVELSPDAQACLENDLRAIRTFRWFIAASRNAPARTPAHVTFEATVDFVDGEGTDRDSTPVQAAFFSELSFRVPEARQQAPPDRTVGFNVTLVNDGNGPVRVSFLVDPGDGASALAPDDVVVPSVATGADTNTAAAVIEASGTLPEGVRLRVYDIDVTVRGVYADDPSVAADEASVTLTLRVERPAEEEATPGPGGLLAAAALAGAALLLLRRRERGRTEGP